MWWKELLLVKVLSSILVVFLHVAEVVEAVFLSVVLLDSVEDEDCDDESDDDSDSSSSEYFWIR